MRYSYHLRATSAQRHTLIILATLISILLIFILLFSVEGLNIPNFLSNFSTSLIKIVLSYFIALAIALILALVTLKSKSIEKFALPLLDVLQSFPSFALLPLLLAYFGKSFVTIIVILIIAMVWPILFSIIGGFKGQRQDLEDAATILGAKGAKRLIYYTLPSLTPPIVTGSIVAWGEAWETVIGAEIILGSKGLGNFFSGLAAGEKGPLIIAVVGLLILLFVLNKIIWLPLLDKVTKYQNE